MNITLKTDTYLVLIVYVNVILQMSVSFFMQQSLHFIQIVSMSHIKRHYCSRSNYYVSSKSIQKGRQWDARQI